MDPPPAQTFREIPIHGNFLCVRACVYTHECTHSRTLMSVHTHTHTHTGYSWDLLGYSHGYVYTHRGYYLGFCYMASSILPRYQLPSQVSLQLSTWLEPLSYACTTEAKWMWLGESIKPFQQFKPLTTFDLYISIWNYH